MNNKMIFSTLGKLLILEAALMLLPLLISLLFGEGMVAVSFLIGIAIAGALGALLYFTHKTTNKTIFATEEATN